MLPLRVVRELLKRSVIGNRSMVDLGTFGNNVHTERLELNTAALALPAGVLIAKTGAAVHCHVQTFAGCRAEVYFGEDNADGSAGDALWQPLSRGQRATPPNGEEFKSFRVRLRSDSSVAATRFLVLVVDQAPFGQAAMEQLPETPHVDVLGATSTNMQLVRRSDGTTGVMEGADGSIAGRAVPFVAGLDAGSVGRVLRVMANGALNVASVDTGGTQRELLSAAAALADGLTPGAGTLFTAGFGYVFDGANWDRELADAGAAGAGVKRVAPATTATAVTERPTAGAASGAAVAANARRRACVIKNLSTTETAYFDFGGTAAAVATGYPIGPGDSHSFTTVEAINAIRGAAADVSLAVVDESY